MQRQQFPRKCPKTASGKHYFKSCTLQDALAEPGQQTLRVYQCRVCFYVDDVTKREAPKVRDEDVEMFYQ